MRAPPHLKSRQSTDEKWCALNLKSSMRPSVGACASHTVTSPSPCPPTSASVTWLYARQNTGDAMKSFAHICSCTCSVGCRQEGGREGARRRLRLHPLPPHHIHDVPGSCTHRRERGGKRWRASRARRHTHSRSRPLLLTVIAAHHARLLLRDADVSLHARRDDGAVAAASAPPVALLAAGCASLRVVEVDRSSYAVQAAEQQDAA